MNLWQWFTGGTKIIDDIFDSEKGLLVKAGGFINDLNLSDSERITHYNNFYKSSLEESTQRSKTRRNVAVKWMEMQIFLIKLTILSVFMDFLAIRLEVYTEFQLSSEIAGVTFSPFVWSITAGIGAFFFGTHLLRSSKASKD